MNNLNIKKEVNKTLSHTSQGNSVQIFLIWSHGLSSLNSFHDHLNNISPLIQFTKEIQEGASLPFLDVLIMCQSNESLTYQLYQNKAHTDRFLHAHSHHHPAMKSVILKTLATREIWIAAPSFLKKV